MFTPAQISASRKAVINNNTCQDVGPLLQNYINDSELTWLQDLSGEQTQKTP